MYIPAQQYESTFLAVVQATFRCKCQNQAGVAASSEQAPLSVLASPPVPIPSVEPAPLCRVTTILQLAPVSEHLLVTLATAHSLQRALGVRQ